MRSKIPFLLILLLGAIPAFSEKVPINTPLPVKAASSMNPEDLLRLIENYHSFGCDLNEDGQTDLLDILIAARDGVVDCPYNIPFYINSDPGSATAFVVGRFPNQVILYGNKDAQGNLMEALSLEIQFKNEQSIFLSLDPAGFPDGVTAELGALQIAFASPDIIAYEGWIDGVSAEGDALAAMDFSAFTAGYEDLDSKRSLPAAILDCTEEKSEIVTEILFPQTYPLTEVSEGAILFLSYLLLESDLLCECLSKAFFDDPDTPMVRQLIALQKLMVRIRIRGQQILGVYKECANSPGCVPALKDRLESMLKDFNKALFVILWISDDLFEQIAMTIEGCGLPTPTPQPSFPTGEYVMIGGYLADEQAGMLEKYLVNITYDHDNIYRINTSRRGYDATASGGSLVVHTTYSGTTEDAVYTDIGNNRYSVSITYSYPGDDYFVEGTLYPRDQWGPMTGYYSGTAVVTETMSNRTPGTECVNEDANRPVDMSLFDIDGEVQMLTSSMGFTLTARNNWQNPNSFASSATETARWSRSRGGTSYPGCGLVSKDETEVMTLSPNEDGTHLSGSFLFSVEYTDGTAESQRFAIEMDGGNGEF